MFAVCVHIDVHIRSWDDGVESVSMSSHQAGARQCCCFMAAISVIAPTSLVLLVSYKLSSVLQLAPFPFDLVCRELRRYPNAEVRPAYVIRHAVCLSACIASGLDKALHCMILQLRPSCGWMHASVQGWLWRYPKAEPGGAERSRHPPLSCERICR